MAPVWFGPNSHPPMNSMRQGRFLPPPPGQHRMNNGGNPPPQPPPHAFQRGSPPMQGHPYPPMNRVPGPNGPPPPQVMHRGPPPRRFAAPPQLPPPQMRMPSPASFGDCHPPHLAMRRRGPPFPPMHRPVPSSPSSQGHLQPQMQGPPRGMQGPPGPPPLRESRIHNVQPYEMPSFSEFSKDENTPPKPANPRNPDASRMQDAASILLGMRSTVSPIPEEMVEPPLSITEESSREIKPFPTRLALPEDADKLNSMHCYLRSELLELFLVESKYSKAAKRSSPTSIGVVTPCPSEEMKDTTEPSQPSSSSGRIGLRCVHCAQARKVYGFECEAPMAVFYPKSLSELYRLVTSWQRVHLRKCRNLPKAVRETYASLKEKDKTRGKTHYWITSAREIGLVDCTSKAGGIRFSPSSD